MLWQPAVSPCLVGGVNTKDVGDIYIRQLCEGVVLMLSKLIKDKNNSHRSRKTIWIK